MSSNGTYNSSLRRCDLYDNPYNTRLQANPDIVRQRQLENAHSKDSMSSAQVKLEKDVLKLFNKQNFKIFPGGLLLIGKMGKFVFLVVMVPTYLFFYGIPKWMITQAAPQTFRFVEKIFTNLKSKVGSAVSFVASATHALVKKATDPILNYIQTRIEKTREFYHHVKQRVEQLVAKVVHIATSPFRIVKERVIDPVAKVCQKIRQTVEATRERLNQFRYKVRETLILFPNRVADYFQTQVERLKVKLIPILESLLRPLRKGLSVVQKIYEKTELFVQKILAKPRRFVQQILQKIKQRVKSVVSPVIRMTHTVKEKVVEFIDKVITPVKEKVSEVAKKVSKSIERITEKVTKQITQVSEAIVQTIAVPVISFFTSIYHSISNVVNQKMIKKTGRVAQKIKKMRDKIHARLAAVNQRFLGFMKRSFQWLKPKILAAPMRISKIMKRFSFLLKEMLKGAFLLLRLLLAWVKVLIQHGMKAVYQIASNSFPSIR